MSRVVETDSRGRVSLKKLGLDTHKHFQATRLENGNVLLEPLVLVTAAEANVSRLLPDIAETVQANHEQGFPVAVEGAEALHAAVAGQVEPSPQAAT